MLVLVLAERPTTSIIASASSSALKIQFGITHCNFSVGFVLEGGEDAVALELGRCEGDGSLPASLVALTMGAQSGVWRGPMSGCNAEMPPDTITGRICSGMLERKYLSTSATCCCRNSRSPARVMRHVPAPW